MCRSFLCSAAQGTAFETVLSKRTPQPGGIRKTRRFMQTWEISLRCHDNEDHDMKLRSLSGTVANTLRADL